MRDGADDPLWYDRDEDETTSSRGIRLTAFIFVVTSALWSLPDRLSRGFGRLMSLQRA